LPEEGQYSSRLRQVRLAPLATLNSDRLSVRMLLVGKLSGLSGDAAKNAFADNIFGQLAGIFTAWGVTLSHSVQIVDPDGPAVSVEFGTVFQELPGTRVAGSAHLYFVDNIHLKGSPPGAGTILGFAPREAMNLDLDRESRVVLNASAGGASLLATTAAHELGHFFGLRHTTATDLDIEADNDGSNRDDGYASTDLCLDALNKVGAEAGKTGWDGGPPYCLYVARPSCPVACDLTNLMFPYDCSRGTTSQRVLTGEQQDFLRGGLGLLGAR
jgi:hypothetical protein